MPLIMVFLAASMFLGVWLKRGMVVPVLAVMAVALASLLWLSSGS